MIQDIDFLPAAYRKQQEGRRRTLGRRVALAAFLLLCVLGVIGQRQVHSHLEARKSTLQRNAQRMIAQLRSTQELKEEIARLDRRASLLTLLQLQPRPTRVLSTITGALPPYVSLSELSLRYEVIPSEVARTTRVPAPGKPKETAPVPPEDQDRERLLKEYTQRGLVISVSGTAPHDLIISEYLAALKKSNLFSDIALLYTDQQLVEDLQFRRFAIRLTVRRVPLAEPVKPTPAPPALAQAGAPERGRTP